MSIFEYDEELHMRQEREAARKDGIAEGLEQGRLRAISRLLEKLSPDQVVELGFDADEVRKVKEDCVDKGGYMI